MSPGLKRASSASEDAKRHPTKQLKLTGQAWSSSPSPSDGEDSTRSKSPKNSGSGGGSGEHLVLRKFYPPLMSTERAKAYRDGKLPRPIDELTGALQDTAPARRQVPVRGVVHWFRTDLRISDNRALSLASDLAREHGAPLVGIYVLSPGDWEAHSTGPVRVDFHLRSVRKLREEAGNLSIPVVSMTVDRRKEVPRRILDWMAENGFSHVFANMEYEVDELRRDARTVRLASARGLAMEAVHDSCVVPPGALASRAGAPVRHSVFTRFYHAWLDHLGKNPELLEAFEDPRPNPREVYDARLHHFPGVRKIQGENDDDDDDAVPPAFRLSEAEAERFACLWPSGEREARDRLEHFCETRLLDYAAHRNYPDKQCTSALSPHFAAGTLGARTAVRKARDMNREVHKKKGTGPAESIWGLADGEEGIVTWIKELAWRDFFRHVMVESPYVCMGKPFRLELDGMEWEHDEERLEAWKQGRTGFPIVDAAMRQLRETGHMHNRLRMVASCFLAKDLRLDWRLGERHFMERLVDGDWASNNGGWGFGASVGTDPQPFVRVFNPLAQSRRFDPDGSYLRRWLPELRDVPGAEVHDPYGGTVGARVAQQAGYPRKIVDHKVVSAQALESYKKAMRDDRVEGGASMAETDSSYV